MIVKNTSIFKIFNEFFHNHKSSFIFLLLILILEGLITSISIISIAPLADYLLDPNLKNSSKVTSTFLEILNNLNITPGLTLFSIIFIASNFIKGIFEILIKYSVLLIKYRVQRNIISDLLLNFLRARWSFFSSEQKGKLLNTFNRELLVVGDTLGHLTMQFAQFFQLCIYLIIPFWISPMMTITAISIAVAFSLPFLTLHKLNYKLGSENTRTANIAMSIISEIFSGIKIILGYSKQEKTIELYQKAFDNHVNATVKSQTLAQSIQSIYQPIGIAAAILSLSYAITSGVKISDASIVLWSLFRSIPILGMILKTNLSISNFIPSYEQLTNLKNRAIKSRENDGRRLFISLKKSIKFQNINFSYSKKDITIKNLNISINKNCMNAIVGESGSGKSTIIDLILGFQKADSGNIMFDNTNIKELDINSFRSKVGYVPQDTFLFNGTIKENLTWALDDNNQINLEKKLDKLGLQEFIDKLPDGINTEIGDNGVKLSGGQKQRIALARALIRKPEIIILDEATSSLDTETENAIQETLKKMYGKITSIIIAHRLSTIAEADQIFVIKDGGLIEEGSYKELQNKKDGILYKMIMSQHIKKLSGNL